MQISTLNKYIKSRTRRLNQLMSKPECILSFTQVQFLFKYCSVAGQSGACVSAWTVICLKSARVRFQNLVLCLHLTYLMSGLSKFSMTYRLILCKFHKLAWDIWRFFFRWTKTSSTCQLKLFIRIGLPGEGQWGKGVGLRDICF